jgi:hypothetical protein
VNYSSSVRFVLLALGKIGANMGCKFLVALQLEVVHHFIERCALGRTRGFEPPATFGATKTAKTLLLNPYQLSAHGRLCRRAPTTRLGSTAATFWFAANSSFRIRSAVLPDAAENGGGYVKGRSLQGQIWMVCRAAYIQDGFVGANARISGARLEKRNRVSVGSGFVCLARSVLLSNQNGIQLVLMGRREFTVP